MERWEKYIDIIIGNISLEKKWIFSKMLAKDMHQILQIEFKNCIFSASEGKLDTPIFSMAKNL